MNKTVLITGATSGIGRACAHQFAREKYRLIITGRREDRLRDLKNELEKNNAAEVHTLYFDVRNQSEVETALKNLPQAWQKVDILINNAGLAAGKDPIQSGKRENWERMIDTNIKGVLYVSEQIIPQMIARNSGHIVNVGSTAGKETYPGGNVYCATKHAVEAITEGMRQDLLAHNIRVSRVCPGMVDTEFSLVRFDGDQQKADATYQGMQPLKPEDVADAIFYMVTRPPHVCVNDLVLLPTAQANSYLLHRA
jgi:3-hydroxy acid dehydrogenase / malonic semialdehyde reductase